MKKIVACLLLVMIIGSTTGCRPLAKETEIDDFPTKFKVNESYSEEMDGELAALLIDTANTFVAAYKDGYGNDIKSAESDRRRAKQMHDVLELIMSDYYQKIIRESTPTQRQEVCKFLFDADVMAVRHSAVLASYNLALLEEDMGLKADTQTWEDYYIDFREDLYNICVGFKAYLD